MQFINVFYNWFFALYFINNGCVKLVLNKRSVLFCAYRKKIIILDIIIVASCNTTYKIV